MSAEGLIDVSSNYLQQQLLPVLTRETQTALQFRNRSFAIILPDFLSDSICALQFDAAAINKCLGENVELSERSNGSGGTTPSSSECFPYLDWHGPQVGTEEEEPHELVGVDGHQVADLTHRQLPHGNVGRAQAHDLVVDFGLSGSSTLRCHTHNTP